MYISHFVCSRSHIVVPAAYHCVFWLQGPNGWGGHIQYVPRFGKEPLDQQGKRQVFPQFSTSIFLFSYRHDRQTWPSPLDCLATCLTFSLSPHSLIVLPLTIVRKGGLAFLVLYSLLVVLLGAPLLLLELRLGQYSNIAPGLLYRHLCPILAGLGPTVVLFAAIRWFHILGGPVFAILCRNPDPVCIIVY